MNDTERQERLGAVADIIGRTGATGFQIRYTDDETPTVWVAVAEFGDIGWETDSGRDPFEAAFRLAERLVDGGICSHCRRGTVLLIDHTAPPLLPELCHYAYDPELKRFRRECEGST